RQLAARLLPHWQVASHRLCHKRAPHHALSASPPGQRREHSPPAAFVDGRGTVLPTVLFRRTIGKTVQHRRFNPSSFRQPTARRPQPEIGETPPRPWARSSPSTPRPDRTTCGPRPCCPASSAPWPERTNRR